MTETQDDDDPFRREDPAPTWLLWIVVPPLVFTVAFLLAAPLIVMAQ